MNQTAQGLAALAFPVADTPRYGDMRQNFGREQAYFPRAGGIASVYNPQTGQFVDSGGASKYTYDPRTQTYGMAESQAEKLVKGQFGPMGGEGSGGSEPAAGPVPGPSPLSGLHVDWTGFDKAGAMRGMMLGGPIGALAGGILAGINVQTTSPLTGPGTLGSRDTYGANELSPATIAANAAAMQSMQNELMADQAAAAGLGAYGGATTVGTGLDYSSDYAAPDTTNYGGVAGGFQGSFGSGSVGGPSEGGGYTNDNSTAGGSGPAGEGSTGGGLGGVGGGGTEGSNGPGDGTASDYAAGGITALAGSRYGAAGGPVEAMSNANAIGANTGYPQSAITTRAYASPYQQPIGQNVVGAQDAGVDPYTGQAQFAVGGLTALAGGGATQYNLGGYSDGGRLLRGPGDGVSDDIPAVIGEKQPARLADGEFVVPARIVSELGNGSTEAGARKLYAMMDRVQSARKKSIGKDKVATDSKAHRMLPA